MLCVLVCVSVAVAESRPLIDFANTRSIYIACIFLIIVLSLFSGLRSQTTDPDYLNYIDWLSSDVSIQDWTVLLRKDPIFQIIGIFFRSNEEDLVYLMLAISITSLSIKIRILKSPDYRGLLGLGLLFLISRFFLVHEFTQVRVALAISLATLALIYSLEERKILALIIFALGVFTHASTIVLTPLFLYSYSENLRGRSLFGGLVVALLAFLFLYDLYSEDIIARISPYFSEEFDVKSNSLLSFYFLIKVAAVAFLLLQWRYLNRGMRLAMIACLYGIILTIIFIKNDVLSLRLSELTAIFDCICLAHIFIFNSGKYRFLGLGYAIFLSAIFFKSVTGIVNEYHIIY